MDEYAPSLMMVIDDVLSKSTHPMGRVKYGEQAEREIVKLLNNGSMDRGRLFERMKQDGIELSDPYLDKILRKLCEKGIITKGDWGIYRLP